jgi:hypothetical protein
MQTQLSKSELRDLLLAFNKKGYSNPDAKYIDKE